MHVKVTKPTFALLMLLTFSASIEARTSIVDYKDPSFHEPYQVVLLNIRSDLQTKKEAEEKAIKELSKKSHTKFLSYLEIFSPFENYSPEQFVKTLKANKIEAVLFAEVTHAESYNRTLSIPTYETSYGYVGGQSYSFSTPSTSEINYVVSEWVTKIQLYDIENSKIVWQAEANTTGTSIKSMTNDLIKKTISAALDCGLINKK